MEDARDSLDQEACYRAVLTRDPRFDGRFFTGVKTTGIYCRPVCPARTPKRENVQLLSPRAAAARRPGSAPACAAGPRRRPTSAAWRGTSQHRLAGRWRLIEAGALDDGDVDALAARLGVGERHLRRLFRAAPRRRPGRVAQTRRVLLAKHLIHETDLPMAEVALASGLRQRAALQRDVSGASTAARPRPCASGPSGPPTAACG